MRNNLNEENGISSEVQRFAEQLHSTFMIPNIKVNEGSLIINNGKIPLFNGFKNEEFYLVLPDRYKFIFSNIEIIFTDGNNYMDTNDLKNNNFTLCLDASNYSKRVLYHEITHLYEILIKLRKKIPPRNNKSQNLYNITNKYIQSNNTKVNLVKYFYYFDKMETAAQLHEVFQRLRDLYIKTQTDFKTEILQLPVIKIIKTITSDNFINNIKQDINILKTNKDGVYLLNELCKGFNCNMDNLPNKLDKYLKQICSKFILKILKLNQLVVNKIKLKKITAIENEIIDDKTKDFLDVIKTIE
jgi:hypothetical protein